MQSPRSQPRSLDERLAALAEAHGTEVAVNYVADGNPDCEPVNQTFSQFVTEVRRRATALAALGVGPDHVVAFAAPLSETSYPTMVAIMTSAVYAPLNYFLEVEALIRIVRAGGARWMVFHRAFEDAPGAVDKLRHVGAAVPDLRLVVFGRGPQSTDVIDLEAIAPTASPGRSASARRDRVLALFHTGGTTGHPKLVPHTEAMYDVMIDECGAGEGVRPGEAILSGLPLFHTSGALQAGLAPLFNGARIVIPSAKGFRDPKAIANYWRFVSRYRISIGAGVPTVLAALATIEPETPVASIKRFLVGGAPIARATIAKIEAMSGGAEVIEGWGMTETCGFSVMNPHGAPKLGAVGLPFPSIKLEIRRFAGDDSTGERCRTNIVGEVVVRGAIVISRYFDERPSAFTTDGWLRTGDLGRLDEDGYLWITGRVRDLIIRGGHNIDPAAIEEPAYQHPDVQLAAAVGKPDKYAGELPILFVQLKPGAKATEEELIAFLSERVLERAAAPKSVTVVREIPLSGPGKISKLLLRRRAMRDVFQLEIDGLGLEQLQIQAAIVEDAKLGEIAELRTNGLKPDADAQALVAAQLTGYAVPYRWVCSNGDPRE